MVKKFLIKAIILTTVVTVISYAFIWKFSNGYIDNFYSKYIHKQSNALIFGSSRALQGLNPDSVFKHTPYSANALNFAFTSLNSPYSDVYLNAIKKIVNTDSKEGIFILEINPMSLCSKPDSITGELDHREEHLTLSRQFTFCIKPNVEYIFMHYPKPLYKLFLQNNKKDKLKIAHDNGWLELNVKFDTLKFKKAFEKNYEIYKKSYPKYSFDNLRLIKLNETITWLTHYGKVYLVRLPVDPRVRELENKNVPDFDERMLKIAAHHKSEYISFVEPKGSIYTLDGGHMHPFAAQEVSSALNAAIFNKTKVNLKVLTQNDFK